MRKLGGVALVVMFLPMAAEAATFIQEHYRWRNDDGSESTASWKAAQDTAITDVARGTNIRLRFAVAQTTIQAGGYSGLMSADLEYATATNGPWTTVSALSDGSLSFEMTTTSGYANGAGTTSQIGGSGSFIAGKCVASPSNTSQSVQYFLDAVRYSNFEHCFRPTAKAIGNTTYYFRLGNNGGGVNAYSQYARLTMAAGEATEAPVITSALATNAVVAVPFSYRILASGSEPIECGASNLPTGLSFRDGMISGTPTAKGVFNVGLTASNAWGSDSKTLVITLANTAPVLQNSTATIASGSRAGFIVNVSDLDARQIRTYLLVSAPAHGTVEIPAPNQYTSFYGYYTAGQVVGTETFTWKCSDGADDSNIATVTLTITAAPPVPQNQSVCVTKNVTTDIPAAYSGGGGYTYTITKLSGPSHGSVAVSNTTFRYSPAAGYTGPDSFSWNMTVNGTGTTATATCSPWVSDASTNWPTFRGDAFRTGMSPETLSANLQLQWRRVLPLARQAWPGAGASQVWPGAKSSQGYFNTTVGVFMSLDFNYEPIAADGKVFMGSNRDDCMLAYDAATGAELWRAYTDGPIRQAAVYSNPSAGSGQAGKVYAGSDDGFIYCWNANTGALIWKRQAVSGTGDGASLLSRKKVFGNLRLISPWSVRGGLMLDNGVLYFASGLWPLEGTFVGALNPETGKTLWLNEQGPNAPQGYLVRSSLLGNSFHVPCSKSPYATYGLYTGPIDGQASAGGLNSGFAEGLAKETGLRLDYEWAFLASSMTLDPGVMPLGAGPKNGSSWVVFHNQPYSGLDQWPTTITTGSKTYSAADAAGLGVVGTVWRMIAANGRLFVVTEGSTTVNPQIYCFGGAVQSSPPNWLLNVSALPSPNDVWKTRATRILADSGVNDKGVALVLGIGSGRLVDELLLQSSLHVIAVDSDTNKVQLLRRKLSDAGLYGTRGSVLAGEPMTSGLPPYLGRLVVSEDLAAAGWSNGVAFAKGVFRCLRPYDGKAWLFTTGAEHTSFNGWVTSAGLEKATLVRDSGNEFSVLTRVGALPGAIEWTGANGAVTNVDLAVKGRLGVLWYGDTMSDIAQASYVTTTPGILTGGRVVAGSGRTVDAYSGVLLAGTQAYSAAAFGALNLEPWEHSDGQRRSPLFGLLERGYPNVGGVNCGAHGTSYGRMRIGGAVYSHDTGLLVMPFKVQCNAAPGFQAIPANGLVVYLQQQGCECERTPQTSLALTHDPDPEYWGENWCNYAFHRLAETIEETPIMRLGVNFGAPAEHMNTNGMLWVRDNGNEFYNGNGIYSTPYEPGTAQRYYHHSMRMLSSEGPKWVASSGLRGALKIRIPVAYTPVAQWANSSPAIDGNLSDSCWGGANPTLLNRAGDGSGSSWFRYDSTNLYIGGFVRNPGDPNNDPYNRNPGWAIYLADRDQVVPLGGATKGIEFGINRLGVKWANVRGGGSQSTVPWTGVWSGAMVWSGTTNCVAEFAVPWTSLAAEGFRREKLVINVVGPGGANIRGGICGFPGYEYTSGVGFYVPLHFDQVTGLLGSPRPYKVRLHFAETEGAEAGERVFNVKLQGSTVLTDFDIFTVAGGADRGIVREFTGVPVGNELVVEFVPKLGDPVICGVELDAQFTVPNLAPVVGSGLSIGADNVTYNFSTPDTIDPEGDNLTYTWTRDGSQVAAGASWSCNISTLPIGEHRIKVTASDGRGGASSYEWTAVTTGGNAVPNATFTASQTAGLTGMTANFDASGSSDPDGSISNYAWDYMDGATGSGPTTSHTFTNAGSWNVRLTVTDNGGATRSTNLIVYAINPAAPHITSALNVQATVGKLFNYTIEASGSTPMTFGASGLPAWLTRSGATISGMPPVAGTSNNVTLTASNASGADTKTLAVVTYMNRAPVAVCDAAAMLKDATDELVVADVLANDSDEDGDPLTVLSVTQPAYGVVVNKSSSLTYQPTSWNPGADSFTYTVSDGRGGLATGTVYVTVNNTFGEDFICKIRSSLATGDYTNLSSWAAAIRSDVTDVNSKVFPVSNRGTYNRATDDGAVVTFTGGGTGVLKHITIGNAAYVVGCGGTIQAGPVSCPSGSFTISSSGRRIGGAVAECYNDWPNGMPDVLTMAGWGGNAVNRARIVAPAAQRHTGKPFDGTGKFTGFAIAGGMQLNSPVDCVGLVVSGNVGYVGASVRFEKGIVYRGGVSGNDYPGGSMYMLNSLILKSPG
ncbi:MAG: hypothetical protein C0404_11420, partial [Verrucomicrobia bacterium]|nr:hypothetical protein [Verrucomicrobiota bacterium]